MGDLRDYQESDPVPERKKPPQPVWILYKNWRDQTAWRYVMPRSIEFGLRAHHPGEAQWFLEAMDLKKKVPRSFAMKDIARWQTETPRGKTP